MAYHFDRAYYRLVYPMALRPRLVTDGRIYEVADLSEQGLRFIHPGPDLPVMGSVHSGVVRLPTGESLEVQGSVVRLAMPSVSLQLSKGVPYAVMMVQQRFIKQRTFVLS